MAFNLSRHEQNDHHLEDNSSQWIVVNGNFTRTDWEGLIYNNTACDGLALTKRQAITWTNDLPNSLTSYGNIVAVLIFVQMCGWPSRLSKYTRKHNSCCLYLTKLGVWLAICQDMFLPSAPPVYHLRTWSASQLQSIESLGIIKFDRKNKCGNVQSSWINMINRTKRNKFRV